MRNLRLALFVVLVVGAGFATGFLNPAGSWYAALAKPWFNPPNRLFAPVWSIVYLLVAVAGWRTGPFFARTKPARVVCEISRSRMPSAPAKVYRAGQGLGQRHHAKRGRVSAGWTIPRQVRHFGASTRQSEAPLALLLVRSALTKAHFTVN